MSALQRTRRLSAGYYRVADSMSPRTALVTHIVTADLGDGYGARDHWLAVAERDRDLVSDPEPTKRDAVEVAFRMIQEARDDD